MRTDARGQFSIMLRGKGKDGCGDAPVLSLFYRTAESTAPVMAGRWRGAVRPMIYKIRQYAFHRPGDGGAA